MENWETEEAKINHWTSILGLSTQDFTIEKPATEEDEIIIRFHKPLELEVVKIEPFTRLMIMLRDCILDESKKVNIFTMCCRNIPPGWTSKYWMTKILRF